MLEPNPPAILSQVLVDPTGRRRRRLAVAGRVGTMALGLWLIVLILGGLGLQPLAGLPIVGDLGAGGAAPPTLPERVQAAVARRATVAPTTRAVQTPVTTVPTRSHRPAVTAPSRAKTRSRARTPTLPGRTKTPPGREPTSPVPSRPATSPSTTAPGQTRTPPGKTKTVPVPPTGRPDTPGGNARGTNGTVTTP